MKNKRKRFLKDAEDLALGKQLSRIVENVALSFFLVVVTFILSVLMFAM